MKILILDIENSFLLTAQWSLWDKFTPLERLLDEGMMLCWSAKWLDEKEIYFARYEEPEFLSTLHAFLDEADTIVTFNGKHHDVPIINREFLKADLGPPSPYKHIDLYQTVSKKFKFPSNKMQHVLTELDLGSKLKHEGFDLWKKCMVGDKQAWSTMRKYNMMDVKRTEQLYRKLLPWISSHPNRSLYAKEHVCPHCGSKHLQRRGFDHSRVATYQRWWCNKCGAWSRSRFTELDLEVRKNIVVPIA